MKQTAFASLSYAAKKKRSRREVFLGERWRRWCPGGQWKP
jgi:hypothetical protein